MSKPIETLALNFGLHDTGEWNMKEARIRLATSGIAKDRFRKILYRPFDIRWVYHDSQIVTRPRHEIQNHMYKDDNIALVVGRSGRALPENWDLVFITNNITDLNIFYRGGGNTFPLYIRDGFSGHWKSNLSHKFIEKLEQCFDKKVKSIDVMFYIFAVLNCPLYREQFSQELEQDFPHIPITKDFGLFSKIVKFGNQLYSYYTLRSENPIKISFPKNGTDKVELVKYDEETKRVYINKEQYFAGVSTQTWKYSVGSYFVCEKWLKDRKNKVLSLNEIQTYIKIASTIPNILSLWIQLDDTFEDILNNEILSFAPGNMEMRMDEFKKYENGEAE